MNKYASDTGEETVTKDWCPCSPVVHYLGNTTLISSVELLTKADLRLQIKSHFSPFSRQKSRKRNEIRLTAAFKACCICMWKLKPWYQFFFPFAWQIVMAETDAYSLPLVDGTSPMIQTASSKTYLKLNSTLILFFWERSLCSIRIGRILFIYFLYGR